jgi:hypothetical protein
VIYPFKLLSTWVHELCHGLVMLATGAGFSHLEIYRDTSGIAFASSQVGAVGNALIASAGYLGASIAGATLLVLGQGARAARRILIGLAVLLALTVVVWVDNDFGRAAITLGSGVCMMIGAIGREQIAIYAVNFVAAQACIQAVLDIRVLFRTELVIDGQAVQMSDANAMAAATFGSGRMWAAIWLAISLAAFFGAMRAIKRRELAAAPAAEPASSGPAEP